MKVLVVIDIQNDFIDGSLGTPEAQLIVPKVIDAVRGFDGKVIFTMDTHTPDYLETQEGRNLPIKHCIPGTPGWELPDALKEAGRQRHALFYRKPTFGCTALARDLVAFDHAEHIDEIELVGLCTDICVISNALMIKAFLPEVPISVDSSCCAGMTPASHEAALTVMRSCQIAVR